MPARVPLLPTLPFLSGARALFAQLGADALPAQWLSLASCEVGDAGLASLANALERGALPRLRALKLQCNTFGATGTAALGACVGSGALAGLSPSPCPSPRPNPNP